eukprot:symbB.v1.2.013909.t3/scaffold935.1/size150374/6
MPLIAWTGAWSSSRFFDAFKQKHVLGILRTFSDERRVLIRKGQTHPWKGVNLGGWLLLEPGPSAPLSTGRCEWDLMETLRRRQALDVLHRHRETFIQKEDFQAIKNMGLNAVRVPFGYWIVLGPSHGDPYEGPALNYLDRAVQWAEECDLEVLLDLHGCPGGESPDAPCGRVHRGWDWTCWRRSETLQALEVVARRYCNRPNVKGLAVCNEPSRTIPSKVLAEFYDQAVSVIRASGMTADRATTDMFIAVLCALLALGPGRIQCVGDEMIDSNVACEERGSSKRGLQGFFSWLSDWRLQADVGREGWRGSAFYGVGEHNLRLHAQGLSSGAPLFSEVGATLNLKPQEGSLVQVDGSVSRSHPFRLTGLVRHQIQPLANLTAVRSWPEGCRKLLASLGASASTTGERMAETELRQPCGEDLDLALRLRLVRPALRPHRSSLSTSAEASYNLAGGKLVGTLTKHAKGGTQVAASYRLGNV